MINSKVNFSTFFDLILNSSACLLCGHSLHDGQLICQGCHSDLHWLIGACPQCAEPLPNKANDSALPCCGKCLHKAPHFNQTLAPLQYLFPINFLVSQLKHQAKPDLLQLCSDLFLHRFEEKILAQPPQLIIPVPLHRNRLYQRGYNQATEWARYLSKQLNIPVDQDLCTRLLDTPHQQGLTAKQRHRNLARAFRVKPHKVRSVAIVDDVMTTGTTLNCLAKELRKSGITHIENWCLARTPSHH